MWQKDTEEMIILNIGPLYIYHSLNREHSIITLAETRNPPCKSLSGTNVLWDKCPVGQMSQWDKCTSGTNVPVGQISSGTKVPVVQMSKWDQCLSGTNVQWDKCPVGQMSVGQLSVGQLSVGVMSVGQMSHHHSINSPHP